MVDRVKLLSLCCLLAASAACHKTTAGEHVQRGTKFAADKKDPEAIVEFRLAEQADPRLGEARLKLADAYLRVGDAKNALGEYVRAADLLPQNVEAQVKAGRILLVARAFDEAKRPAPTAPSQSTPRTWTGLLRGNALAGLKDLDGAITEYEDAIALDPTKNVASSNLGMIQFAQGKREEAEETFRKAVASSPQSVTARLALANFLWASGRQPESEQAMKDALALDPKNIVANRALGLFYMATGRAAQAEPYFLSIANVSNSTVATLALADYYIAVKRYDDARRTLHDLTIHPDTFATATVRLASIHALEGDRAQAQARLREVLDKQPKDAPALLLSARLFFVDGKREEALTEAQAIIANDPASPMATQAYQLAGQIHTANDRVEDAIAAYEQVLKRAPRPLAADLALARLQQLQGDASKAATYAQEALSIDPGNPDAQTLLIRSHVAAGEIDKAKRELEPLQRAFPNSPTVADLVAFVQLAEKHLDAALGSYAKALQLAPGDLEALEGSARIELAAGRKKDATARIESQLARAKPSVELLILAARTYTSAGDLEKAEASLQKAIEADPNRLQAYDLLGQLYVKQDRLKEAGEAFNRAIEHDPKSVAANTFLAILYERQGHAADAEDQYQRVLTLDPHAAVAANNLAWIYVAGNRQLDEALQLAKDAYQALPDDPNVNDTLGWVYYRKNMMDEAIPYLETSARRVPSDATYQFHLGLACVKSGNWDKARRALKQALALKPDFEGAAEAQKALGMIGA